MGACVASLFPIVRIVWPKPWTRLSAKASSAASEPGTSRLVGQGSAVALNVDGNVHFVLYSFPLDALRLSVQTRWLYLCFVRSIVDFHRESVGEFWPEIRKRMGEYVVFCDLPRRYIPRNYREVGDIAYTIDIFPSGLEMVAGPLWMPVVTCWVYTRGLSLS